MYKYIIGVDIGGRSIGIGIFKTNGVLVHRKTIRTRTERNGINILPDLSNQLKQLLYNLNINKEEVKGIGIGVPGASKNNRDVISAVNLGWNYKEVASYMEKKLKIKTKIDNDANLAALGEYWKGAGRGHENMVMVTLGTGVGSGIIIDGKSFTGNTGSLGEIGHMPILSSDSKRQCNCGGKRCLELVASATGIENITRDRLKDTKVQTSLRKYKNINAKYVFKEAQKGDKFSLSIVDYFSDILGRALAIVASTVDPSLFVIGGGMAKSGKFLMDRLQRSYKKYAFVNNKNIKFTRAKLSSQAGIYGAAKLFI